MYNVFEVKDMNKNEKRWVLFILILAGLVIGGLFGEFAKRNSALWWLSYGMDFGLPGALHINLVVLTIQFGFTAKITIANIIGVIIGIFMYKYLT